MNPSQRAMIEARGLSKYYGSFVAIQDVSFTIGEAEIVAFLGPNGAGKTTTMRILTGYVAPTAGSATIAGWDVRTGRLEASRVLGYLPENGPLYPGITPLEILRFFADAHRLDPATRARRIDEVVARCSLGEVLEKPVGKLSRGFRQRVGLARALLHDPQVLIMDEPTAGLDPNQIQDFRTHIRELGRTRTVLLSTHILQEVEAVADRVLLVNEGRLVFDGTPEELRAGSTLESRFHAMTGRGEVTP